MHFNLGETLSLDLHVVLSFEHEACLEDSDIADLKVVIYDFLHHRCELHDQESYR